MPFSLGRDLLEALFPWRCPLCGGRGQPPAGICAPCLSLWEVAPTWRCLACGRPLGGASGSCCPRGRHHFLDGLLAAVSYEEAARRAVHQLKFGRNTLSGRAMGEILAGVVENSFDVPCRLVVPVPLSRKRQRERGFNQAGLLARRIGRRLSLPVAYDLMERTRETESQAGLPISRRRENLAGAFRLRPGSRYTVDAILLVDDVYTTGTTMNECARVLKESGATAVFGAVFACSPWRAGGEPAPDVDLGR